MNTEKRQYRRWRTTELNDMAELYQKKNHSIGRIALKYGVPATTIGQLFHRNNIKKSVNI